MPAMTTFQTVLKELADAFESAKRADGTKYTRIRENAPSWIAESRVMLSVHAALDDRLPDDWTYEAAESCADSLVDHDVTNERKARNAVHEIADGLVDPYNHDRLQWLASHLGNAALVDEACEDCESNLDTFDRIGRGQYLAYERICEAVITACESEADSRDESTEDV